MALMTIPPRVKGANPAARGNDQPRSARETTSPAASGA